MNNFEDSIARMKALYTYGTVSEGKKQSTSTLEYSAKAADGKTYGIVRECNHWYIKQAANGKENLAEGYDYIGGYMNKNNYKYDSYANALKHFELKMSSINEAQDAKINISTLDPFKKEDILAEASDKMKNEIARQRQIMYNAGMIMNESTNYAVKGGAACSTSQPEAETGAKGDKMEGSKDAKAEPEYKGSHVGLDKKAEPFKENPGKGKDMNESCEGGSCNKATATDFDNGMDKGRDPKEIGWDMENQQKVNEEGEKEWDKGLPGSAGVGEADTDHNNDPFNKSVNEGAEDELGSDAEGEDFDGNDVDFEDEDDFDFDEEDFDEDLDTDFDDGVEDVPGEDEELGGEEPAVEDELGDDMPSDDEPIEDEPVDESDPESIRNEIERLQGLLDSLESGEDEELGGEEPAVEDELGDEEGFEEGGEDDFDGEGEEEFSEEDFEDDGLGDEEFEDDEEIKFESKKRFMNSIVESVVKSILKEDELHDFGKHPGYRKKPMDLPPTGEDKNEHGEDWNDESVHSEEPFGKQIGDSSPFNQLVDAVTQDVMYQLKHGIPLDNKKKAE